MYPSKIHIDAIRTIDKIVRTPEVNDRPMTAFSINSSENFLQNEKSFSQLSYEELVEEASAALEVVNTELAFHIHEGTGRPVIQLVEANTRKVIREIPPEKMLDIVAGIWEWAGLFVDRKE